MSDKSANNKRIAKNTLVLYFRMLFLMLISLYTSRVILDALGVEDYGIYNVVGGFVSMFGLISVAMTGASQRFLNVSMGKDPLDRQVVIFSTIVSIQWALAIVVAILAEVMGIWYLENIMVLPADRLYAAHWCFQFSVITFCLNIITVPYNAAIVAHERMGMYAYMGIFQGVSQLAISFLVYKSPIDKLIYYAALLFLVQMIIRSSYQIYCRKKFVECQYKKVLDKPLLKEIFSYTGWHLMGCGATVMKGQGVNLVLNFFSGPIVNAARGISSRVEGAVTQFSHNFMIAMNPQIIQSYAKRDFEYSYSLAEKGSRFSFYMMLIISLPIIINADFILHIWLKEVPDYTVAFIQIMLFEKMVASISSPLITIQNATGQVRKFQLVVGGILLLNVPLVYISLKLGASPIFAAIIALAVELATSVARCSLITGEGFKPFVYFRKVHLRCLFVAAISFLLPTVVCRMTDANVVSFILNVLLDVLYTGVIIYFLGCNRSERTLLSQKMNLIINKIRK